MSVRAWPALRLGLLTVLSTALVAGCATQNSDAQLLMRGPQQTFDGNGAEAFAKSRNDVLQAISTAAGFDKSEPQTPTQWKAFVITGFDYADSQCEDYITAIRRLNIVRRQVTQELNLVGTATAGFLGLARAASAAIAATAVAFGFTQATVDNLASGLLYELPPYAVRDLVTRLRIEYSNNLTENNWSDRATSFRTIRGYVQLCLPAVIEAHAATAIATASTSTIKQASGSDSVGSPPAVTVNKIATSGPQPPQNPPVIIHDIITTRLDPAVQARKNNLLRFVRTVAARAIAGETDQVDLLHRIVTALGVTPVSNLNEQRRQLVAEIDRLISSPDRDKATEQMNAVALKLTAFGAF